MPATLLLFHKIMYITFTEIPSSICRFFGLVFGIKLLGTMRNGKVSVPACKTIFGLLKNYRNRATVGSFRHLSITKPSSIRYVYLRSPYNSASFFQNQISSSNIACTFKLKCVLCNACCHLANGVIPSANMVMMTIAMMWS